MNLNMDFACTKFITNKIFCVWINPRLIKLSVNFGCIEKYKFLLIKSFVPNSMFIKLNKNFEGILNY